MEKDRLRQRGDQLEQKKRIEKQTKIDQGQTATDIKRLKKINSSSLEFEGLKRQTGIDWNINQAIANYRLGYADD